VIQYTLSDFDIAMSTIQHATVPVKRLTRTKYNRPTKNLPVEQRTNHTSLRENGSMMGLFQATISVAGRREGEMTTQSRQQKIHIILNNGGEAAMNGQ